MIPDLSDHDRTACVGPYSTWIAQEARSVEVFRSMACAAAVGVLPCIAIAHASDDASHGPDRVVDDGQRYQMRIGSVR
jgi:hypothetical protein